MKIGKEDFIKAVKKADREIEIGLYGKQLRYGSIYKNKKAYSRKNGKIINFD